MKYKTNSGNSSHPVYLQTPIYHFLSTTSTSSIQAKCPSIISSIQLYNHRLQPSHDLARSSPSHSPKTAHNPISHLAYPFSSSAQYPPPALSTKPNPYQPSSLASRLSRDRYNLLECLLMNNQWRRLESLPLQLLWMLSMPLLPRQLLIRGWPCKRSNYERRGEGKR
jgi:hypothetical protein